MSDTTAAAIPALQEPPGAQPSRPVAAWAAGLWKALKWCVGGVIAAWSVLLLAWLTLHWAILPHIENWRGPLEQRASRALGVPVRIGHITVRSSGWVPAFELRDVVLLDARGQPALALPRVVAALSPRSLLALAPRFEQLLIDGAALEVRRDATGRIFVAGLDFDAAAGRGAADRRAANWFFQQHEFVVRGGTVSWVDEGRTNPQGHAQGQAQGQGRSAEPLVLGDVQLVVRNGLRRHQIRLDATPPAAWGERFSLRGDFTQALLAERGDWRRWSGTAFAELPRADVSELRRHVQLPFDLTEGDGAVRAWVALRNGRPEDATVDLALRAVKLQLDSRDGTQALPPLDFQQVHGRLTGRLGDDGGRVEAQGFGFLTADGIAWPRSDVTLAWTQAKGDAAASGGEFRADRLDLALMSQVATRLPIGAPVRALLSELRPEGVMSGVQARWRGPLDAPTGYDVKARLDGLSLAARAAPAASAPAAAAAPVAAMAPGVGVGRPGLRNASVQLAATEKGGTATLAIAQGALDLPGVFADPLVPLERWSSALSWRIEPAGAGDAMPRVSLQVKDARFANADVAGDMKASWTNAPAPANGARNGTPALPGALELDGRLTRGSANRVARYLPLGIPADTRRYVELAVRSGAVSNVAFRVKGDLARFPFGRARTAEEGEFRIAGRVEDATFAFVPNLPASGAQAAVPSPWPALTGMTGELIFDRASMEIRNARAQMGGVSLTGVQGGIRDLEHSVLALEGSGRGTVGDMLRVVNSTPLGGWAGRSLDRASGSGSGELKLALNIPLADVNGASVKGSVIFPGNDLRITPDSMPLLAARGRVDFSQAGFKVVGASARVLGGELAFEGGSAADGTLRFNGQGSVSADALRRAPELGSVARLAGLMSGQTRYRASFALLRGRSEVSITSNLVGMALDLPSPLRKAADAPLALRYQTTLAPDAVALNGSANTAAARDTLRLELGNVLQAQYLRDLSGDAPRVLRGGIGLLEAVPPLPAAGVTANLNLGSVNLDAWEAVTARIALPPAAPAAPAAGAVATPFGEYGPTSLGLRAQELVMNGKRLTRLVAGLSLDDGTWRTNLESEQLGGYIEYRTPRRAGAGRVYARLAHLSLPKGEGEDVDQLLDAPTLSVPALDITIDDLQLRGKRMGRVEVEAVNRQTGEGRDAVREWRLNKLTMTLPEARLSATGNWAAVGATGATVTTGGSGPAARRRSVMNFKLELADSGALLDRLGMGRTVRGGKGSMSGQVAWLGSPLAIDYPSLTGQMNVAVDAGQFLKAEPGAARLLGVLSLQALPRRLLLDFRDVFQQGFAFDNIVGDVAIAQGVARTTNLRMRGVQATVAMEGSANLAQETQHLRVAVVPEINAGTASLAYAAINPALGLGTFLAQLVLRKPLQAAGTREFLVTGPWGEPKVEKIDRQTGEPVAEADGNALVAQPPPAAGPVVNEAAR